MLDSIISSSPCATSTRRRRPTRALLGRRPSWRGVHPAWGTANTLFRLDNTYLELLSAVGRRRVRRDAARRTSSATAKGPTRSPSARRCRRPVRRRCAPRGLAAAAPMDGSGRDTAQRRRAALAQRVPAAGGDARHAVVRHRAPLAGGRAAAGGAADDARAAVGGVDHVVIMTADRRGRHRALPRPARPAPGLRPHLRGARRAPAVLPHRRRHRRARRPARRGRRRRATASGASRTASPTSTRRAPASPPPASTSPRSAPATKPAPASAPCAAKHTASPPCYCSRRRTDEHREPTPPGGRRSVGAGAG